MSERTVVDEVFDIGITLDDIRIGVGHLYKSLRDDPQNPVNIPMADEVVREYFAITGRLDAVSKRVRALAGGGSTHPSTR